MRALIPFLSFIFLCGCVSMKSDLGELKTVERIEIPQFMGTWYVIANIPTFVEKGAVNAIEKYTWNEVEGRIDVDFKYNKDTADGEIKSYPQKAWIYNTDTNAEWRVQPLWPFKLAYLVIDLAPDYSYTVVSVPSRNYLWIMARTKTLSPEIYQKILDKVKTQGFDLTKIQKVPQY